MVGKNTEELISCQFTFTFQFLPIALDVLHKQILPRQLVVVWEVVDDLIVVHSIPELQAEYVAACLNSYKGDENLR